MRHGLLRGGCCCQGAKGLSHRGLPMNSKSSEVFSFGLGRSPIGAYVCMCILSWIRESLDSVCLARMSCFGLMQVTAGSYMAVMEVLQGAHYPDQVAICVYNQNQIESVKILSICG